MYDILEGIAEIERFVSVDDSQMTALPILNYNAVLYSLLKVTEAVRHLPDEVKSMRPDLAWAAMPRLGNILRHHYFRVNKSTIADVVYNDLPALKRAIEDIWRRSGFGPAPQFSPIS